MKAARPVFFIALTLAITSLLNSRIGNTPPLGKFFSPFTGFWQNAEGKDGCLNYDDRLNGLLDEVAVKLDHRGARIYSVGAINLNLIVALSERAGREQYAIGDGQCAIRDRQQATAPAETFMKQHSTKTHLNFAEQSSR